MKLLPIILLSQLLFHCNSASWQYVGENTRAIQPSTDPKIDFPFEIEGPSTSPVSIPVTFSGKCGNNSEGNITWRFGDTGQEKTGNNPTYTFETKGTYSVDANCSIPGYEAQKKTLVIIITDPDKGDGSQNQNQNPGQN